MTERAPLAAAAHHARSRDLLTPFWCTTESEDEPVVFIGDPAAPTSAGLLFRPDGQVRVRSATGHVLEPGRDFLLEAGARRMVRPAGSRLPIVVPNDLVADDPAQVAHRTVLVSYAHGSDPWPGPVPAAAADGLPRFHRLLGEERPVRLCAVGDSITHGYDASGFHGFAPAQPAFATIVADGIRAAAPATSVTLDNLAVAGSTSEQGRWLAPDVAALDPDLVLVAFGMNDACYAAAEELAGHLTDFMTWVRSRHPEVEFILVSPMLPTVECTWVEHHRFAEYRHALAALARPGVVLADVTAVWESILSRKHRQDLSGNGSNHPNDFGHRVYAQTVLATIGVGRASSSHLAIRAPRPAIDSDAARTG